MPRPLLVSNLTNIRYLSGVSLTAGLMLLHGAKRTLFVDGRYQEKARDEAKRGIRVLPLDELAGHLRKLRRVDFEAEDVSVARLERWRKHHHGVRFVAGGGAIEEMRRRKTQEELRSIQKACRITDTVLRRIPSILRTACRGVLQYAPTALTERDLAWQIERCARDLGAEAMAFETIVAFGELTSRPHHHPTERRLRHGDIVQIDMGVKVNGYCSDCSRVFFTAALTSEQRKVHTLLCAIVREATTMAKTGAKNTELDAFARNALRRGAPRGRPYHKWFLHSLGHGVGLEIHEGMSLSSKAKPKKLLRNEVVTIEPGVYLEGQWGMRIEDTILVTDRGGISLTKAAYSPTHLRS